MTTTSSTKADGNRSRYAIAWALCLLFYFIEYAGRSAPGVMMPELSSAFGITTLALSTLLGFYYYTYSTFSLVAGASLDRIGARLVLPSGLILLTAGFLLFGASSSGVASVGRLLQGAGSAFAFTGAVYLASRAFSKERLATAIGVTQCLGMIGGSAGQFVVGPLIAGGMSWQTFWVSAGIASLAMAVILYLVTPGDDKSSTSQVAKGSLIAPYKVVLKNPQSYLCGIIAGLLFLPTTAGAMVWGVPVLEKMSFDYKHAVIAAALIPLGWAIGCPLFGWLSDFTGRRKPVIIAGGLVMLACVAWIGFGSLDVISPYIVNPLLGIASGAAMIPYTVIKEANPDEVKGSATGAINFLTFAVTAFLGPLYGKILLSPSAHGDLTFQLFRESSYFWVLIVGAAILLTFLLKETGHGRLGSSSQQRPAIVRKNARPLSSAT
jgi:MFS family permease